METESSLFGWLLGGVATVVATLATAVATLFKMNEGKNTAAISRQENMITKLVEQADRLVERADDCEQDRRRLGESVARLETKLEQIEKK